MGPLDDLLLTESVTVALRLASAERTGSSPMMTSDVLLALMRSDTTLAWDYVSLEIGGLDRIAAFRLEDSNGPSTDAWERVALSPEMSAALRYAAELSTGYQLVPVPPAVLAIALVATPGAGAATMLELACGLKQTALVDLFHTYLLDGSLAASDIFPPPRLAARKAGPIVQPLPDIQAAPAVRSEASEVLARAERLSGGQATAFDLLRAAAPEVDEYTQLTLAVLGLKEPELLELLGPIAEGFGDEPATDVIARARDLQDGAEPDAATLVFAATRSPSPRVARVCWMAGLDPHEIAAAVRESTLRKEPKSARSLPMLLTYIVLLLNVLVSGLVINDAVGSGAWWKLVLILPIWWGHPQFSACVPAAVAVALWIVVSPVAAVVHAVSAVVELAWARSERKTAWARTGVRLTLRQFRRHLQRKRFPFSYLQHVRQRFVMARRVASQ